MNNNDNKQNDKPEGDKIPKGKKPLGQNERIRKVAISSGRGWIFWILILVILPLCFYFSRKGEGGEIVELSSSQFEECLKNKQIVELRMTEQSASMIMKVTGKLCPKDVKAVTDDQLQPFKAYVLYTEDLDKAIHLYCENRNTVPAGGFWGSLLMSVLPLGLMLLIFAFIYGRMIRGANQSSFMFGKSRAHLLDPNREKITMKDVAGCDEAKEDMQEIVDFLKDPVKFNRLGGKIPHGVLMSGPPGTGKTLLAKAIAGEADVPFFSISGSDFVEMFVGVGASRVRDMFEEGKKNAPCLLFIDEIDAVGRSRFTGIGGGHDEREQTLNALLVEMDGFEGNTGVIVIAATNRPDVLDPALMRPGRFDRQINVDLPDQRGRLAILKIHAKKVLLDPKVDLRVIARGTPGFSGADLANVINEAALLATRRNLQMVGLPELEEARDKVCWGKERRSRRLDDKARKLTAYHESGHALMVMLCENATPLHKITIIPRGNAYLGATMELPEQDRVNVSKLELLDSIAVSMGGRVAEELFFQDISAGASADIMHATETAHKMVCAWGMSEKLGFINYGSRESHIFLGRDITKSEDFSPETAREIDMEIRSIIDTQMERVRRTLQENRDKLQKLADTLLERETMNAAEVYELLEMPMPESKRSAADIASDFESDNEDPSESEDKSEKAEGISGYESGDGSPVETPSEPDSSAKPEE